ncbi:hypothetical protein EON63_14315, partial [archaeon]
GRGVLRPTIAVPAQKTQVMVRHTHTHTHTCQHTQMKKCAHIHTHIHTHTHTHIQKYLHTHIYTLTHVPPHSPKSKTRPWPPSWLTAPRSQATAATATMSPTTPMMGMDETNVLVYGEGGYVYVYGLGYDITMGVGVDMDQADGYTGV